MTARRDDGSSAASPLTDPEPAPQLAPWVRGPRSALGWSLLVVGIVPAAVVLLAVGIVAVAVAIVAGIVSAALWILATASDWAWYLAQRAGAPRYPFVLALPTRRAARSAALNDAWVSTLPRALGLIARTVGFLFAPLALLASLAGVVVPVWRARPYVALFTVPALERKLVGLGSKRGYFDDGHDAEVVPYDEFLERDFPQRADFLAWWQNSGADTVFAPHDPAWATPTRFSGLDLGAYPDPLGLPGLALAATRRTRIRGLRELFISQREIDDLGDPDLDDRAEAAVIRIVDRMGADGVRRWVVQLPSTQTWHPRSGVAPNDLTADFVALSHHETTLTRAALVAIGQAGIERGDRVLLAGFSLGGMVAAQLAERADANGFTVTHLVTAGSSIGRTRIDPAVRVLSLEHVLDSVPRLEGRENPIWDEAGPGAPQWVTVKAGPPLPRGYRIALTHHSPSYAETAGALEDDPPSERVVRILDGDADDGSDGIREFFGPGQRLRDYAARRAGFGAPRPAVPLYLHSTVDDGVTRDHLRITLRRVPGVIAVDLYQSRTGFATTILWSADVLTERLDPWLEQNRRTAVYRGLLSMLARGRGVGMHLRLQAKQSPGVTWESTVQRMPDRRWRERIDVAFDSADARAEWGARLMPEGRMSRVAYYAPDALD